MEIINKNINELKPYSKNVKKHTKEQIEYVANSIEKFGWKQPIVIDLRDVVIIGHCRLEAAKKLKFNTVPCIIADDLTDEQIKALRLADNKTNESEWDLELLGEELDEIFSIDMNFFGFVEKDIEWDTSKGLEEYSAPKKEMLKCPSCNHVDSKEHFIKQLT